jgi:hypothetical protein
MVIFCHCLDLGLLGNPEVPVEESGANYVDNNVHPANTKVSPTGRSARRRVNYWDRDIRVTEFESERAFEKLIGGGQSAVLTRIDGSWVDEVATGLRDVGCHVGFACLSVRRSESEQFIIGTNNCSSRNSRRYHSWNLSVDSDHHEMTYLL